MSTTEPATATETAHASAAEATRRRSSPPRAPREKQSAGLVLPPPPGPGATRDEKQLTAAQQQVVASFNSASLRIAQRISRDDVTMGVARFIVLISMCSLVVLAGVALLCSVVLRADALGTVIASGSAFVGSLVVGLIANPLQMIERDIVFRRWSDTIRGTYVTTVADGSATADIVQRAGATAAVQFQALAASYAGFVSSHARPAAAGMAESAAVTISGSISLVNPGPQSSALGAPLAEPLVIVAGGPADLVLSSSPPPPGIVFDPTTRSFSGTPTVAGVTPVTVTASSAGSTGTSSSATFSWTIATA